MLAACLHILTLIAYTTHAVFGCCLHHHHMPTASSSVVMTGHSRLSGCCPSHREARELKHSHEREQHSHGQEQHSHEQEQHSHEQEQHSHEQEHHSHEREQHSHGQGQHSHAQSNGPIDSRKVSVDHPVAQLYPGSHQHVDGSSEDRVDKSPPQPLPCHSASTPHHSHGDENDCHEHDCHEHDCTVLGMQPDRSNLAMLVGGPTFNFAADECLVSDRLLARVVSQPLLFHDSHTTTALHDCALRQVWRL